MTTFSIDSSVIGEYRVIVIRCDRSIEDQIAAFPEVFGRRTNR